MKTIKFKSLQVEGFGSLISPTKFNLDRVGVNIIRGLNGSGKTTVFNALFWCLYGDNLKGTTASSLPTKEEYREDYDWRGTRVALSLIVDSKVYLIARHHSFKGKTKGVVGGSKLMIFEDGELAGDNLDKREQQSFLEDLLGLDSKTFLNSILFGQRMKKFIEADPSEKRKIFESVFDLGFIDDAKSVAREKQADIRREISEYDIEIEKLESKVESLDERIKDSEKVLEEFEDKRKERLEKKKETKKEIENEIKNDTKDLEEFEKELEEIDLSKLEELRNQKADKDEEIENCEGEIRDLKDEIKGCEDEIKESDLRIKEYEEKMQKVDTTCPTCDQPLPKEKIQKAKDAISKSIKSEEENKKVQGKSIKKSEKELKSSQTTLKKLKEELDEIDDKIQDFDTVEEDRDALKDDIADLKADIKANNKRLEEVKSDIKDIKAEKPPEVNINDLKKSKKSYNESIHKYKEDSKDKREELERVNWWIKEGFGSNGLKSYMFNAMLRLLNKSIEKYASRLGFLVKFSIDMEKASKPFLTKCYSLDKTAYDYNEFSGGEKARIDVSSAFAMHDLISSSSNINILIMDEIFEGLDDDGIEDVFDLIRMKGEGRSLYVITHSNTIDSLNCKHINVSKENHNTIIE